jgi:hypothetical protein
MRPAFKLRKAVVATLACFVMLPLASGQAQGQTSVTGAIATYPASLSIATLFTDIGNNLLTVGNGAAGSLSMTNGSILRVGSLGVGDGFSGSGSVTMSGAGTRLDLTGDGFSPGLANRFEVGKWGIGTFVLSNGATIDGRANANACLGVNHFCGNIIGDAAGSNGTFIITGAGTSASFLRGFWVGNGFVVGNGGTYGTPGAATQGSVQVLDGGLLRTQSVILATQPNGAGNTNERTFADVVIRGAGSTWLVEPRTLDNQSAVFSTANGANSWATVTISDGGKLRMEGMAGQYNSINLTNSLGRTDFTVTGINSRVEMVGSNALLQIGTSLGTANMSVLAGAVVDGPYIVNVGRDGARGTLTIDGAGSRFNMYGTGAAGTTDANAAAGMLIGRNGTGTVTVSNGGRLDMSATGPTNRSPFIDIGFQNAGSTGTLNITGANSVVSLTADSSLPGGGATESFNPFVSVGYDGSGTLNVSGGGKLLMNGGAVATATAARSTVLDIGGRSDTIAGGTGIARVTGAGSEIRLTGTDPVVVVGLGPATNGLLTLADSAALTSTILNAGRSGGTGIIKVDNAQINLSGQLAGGGQPGAGVTIGDGTGSIGIVSLQNNARLSISNTGSSGTGVAIGGSPFRTGGSGILNLSSGSVLQITAPAATSGISVGRSGSGQLNVNASTVDVGGGSIYVGRDAGSVGTMTVSANSTVTAGYVGVGRTQSGNGGTGTLIVNGSTLTATTIEIGSSGYLGGNGTIVGNIVNYGTVNPGNSPGTLIIDGSFINGLGGKLVMEVESNGSGGFNTDHLIFKNGSTVNLNGVEVNFHFLGNTDPNAFKASGGFVINQFLQGQDAQGQLVDLAPETFAGASFTAQADQYNFSSFSFSATAGAAFTAAPVPEPGEWMLMLAGLGLIGAISSRRSRSRKVEAG